VIGQGRRRDSELWRNWSKVDWTGLFRRILQTPL
jgi:hypothetical protein